MAQYVSISIDSSRWSYVDGGHGMMPQQEHHASNLDFALNVDHAQLVNINKILHRTKGTVFSAANDNSLEEIQSWDMRRRFKYWWNRDQERARVQPIIRQAIKALDEAVLGAQNLQDPQKKALKQFLEDHFFTSLTRQGCCARMPKSVFDRDALKEGGIQACLAPEVTDKRANRNTIMQEHREGNSPEAQRKRCSALMKAMYAWRNSQVLFSQKLGVPLKQIGSGGSGGARTGHALSEKKVTVIKPGDEGPYGVNTPSWMSWIKQFFLSARKCLMWKSEPDSEEGSSRLDEVLAMGVTPHTRKEEISASVFNGPTSKECSQQMFIGLGKKRDGAPRVQTLGEYLGISGQWSSIPRFLRCCLADHLTRRAPGESDRAEYPHGDSWWKRPIRYLFEKLSFSNAPLPPLNDELFVRAAIMKYLSGDIDTHFDNMLVAILPDEAFAPNSFLDRYFQGEASQEEVEAFCKDGNFDHLLCRLFESRQLQNGEWIAMLNHDGGAAFPNSHPSTWGIDSYLSGRHRFLFETHPLFAKPFPPEIKDYFAGKDQAMLDFYFENAFRTFIGVLGIDPIYTDFRQNPENRLLFKRYLFLGAQRDLEKLTQQLVFAKTRIGDDRPSLPASYYLFYDKKFRGDLKLMHTMTQASLDQYRFMIDHFAHKSEAPMRELFMRIDANDYDQTVLQDSERVQEFNRMIEEMAKTPVPEIEEEDLPPKADYDYFRKHVPELAIRDFMRR